MEYIMSCYDAPTFHHDLPFIPLHYTYVPFTSSSQFTSLHFWSRGLTICLVSLSCNRLFFVFLCLAAVYESWPYLIQPKYGTGGTGS
jgi:hypothetical protein